MHPQAICTAITQSFEPVPELRPTLDQLESELEVAIAQLTGVTPGGSDRASALYPKATNAKAAPAYEAFVPGGGGGSGNVTYEVGAPRGAAGAEMYAIPPSQQQTEDEMAKVQSIEIAPPPPARTSMTARIESEVYEIPSSLGGSSHLNSSA